MSAADAPEILDEPASADAPRTPMVVSATSWSHNLVLGRSGREEGESIVLVGQIAWRGGDGGRRVAPARVLVLAKEARLRLSLVLAPQEAVLTIPLDEFALGRLQERLKEYVSRLGMVLRIAFAAADMPEPQALERVSLAFSSERPPAHKPALTPVPGGAT